MRGRWKSNKTARVYIQTSTSLLIAQSINPRVLAKAASLAKDVTLSMLTAGRRLELATSI